MFGDIPGRRYLFPTIFDTTHRNLDAVMWLERLESTAEVYSIAVTSFRSTFEWRCHCKDWREQIEDNLAAGGRLGRLVVTKERGVRTLTLSLSDHGKEALAALREGYVWDTAERCVEVEQTKERWLCTLSYLKEGEEHSNINRWTLDAIGPMNNPPIPEVTYAAALAKLRVYT